MAPLTPRVSSCWIVSALALILVGPGKGRASAAPATRPATQPTAGAEERFEAVDQPLKIDGAAGDVAEWLKGFDYKPERFGYTVAPKWEGDRVRIYRVTYPSPFHSPWPENNVVPGELFVPKGAKGKGPAAIVLDILDGSAVLPRGLAQGMADQGIIALYVPMACYGPRRPAGAAHMALFGKDPALVTNNFHQTVMDIRRAKALLASRPDVDSQRVAITGVSLGGIVTSLAAGVDGTFYRVVPILAGGDLAAITFHARETRSMREILQAHGIDQAATGKMLAGVEPLHFAGRIAPDSCLMINAERDEVIPRESTDALAKAIGGPRVLWTPMGHYSSIWYLPDIRQRTIDFIHGRKVDRLTEPAAP